MNAIGGYVGDLVENDNKHNGGKNRLNDMPERAKNGLFILGGKISFDKKEKQVPVAPYFF